MQLIRRLMFDYRCGEYEDANNMYSFLIAHQANKWWREHAATEDEKVKIEEFENDSQGKDPFYILKKAGSSEIEINCAITIWVLTNKSFDWKDVKDRQQRSDSFIAKKKELKEEGHKNLALIRRLMLAFPCAWYEDAKEIHHERLAYDATRWWRLYAKTEEEKRLLEEYNENPY